MSIEFKQKRGANSRKFILHSDKIIVESKTLQKINKHEIKLDRLGLDIQYQSDNTMPGKIFLGICILWILVSIFEYFNTTGKESGTWLINLLLGIFMACIAYFKQHQDDIYLVGGDQNLVFYKSTPNENEVLEFIEKVRTHTKSFLKQKYINFDHTTKEEEFYNILNWLRNIEVINQKEYSEYKSNFEVHKLM